MLDKIIRFSVRNKLVIALFTLMLIVMGVQSLRNLPIDAVPDITNNQVQVITVSPAFGAEEIERFITFPVEQTMATIPGMEEVRSFSRFGLSVVTLVFTDETDVYWARQQVNERLAQVRELIPAGMGSPEMAPVTTGLGEIFQYVLLPDSGYADKYTPTRLRTLQDWMVRRQLLGVPGVADVSSFGGYVLQYEVAVNPANLRAQNLSIPQILDALNANNQNAGGAYIDARPNAWFVRAEGLIRDLDDLGSIPVRKEPGKPALQLRHVATLREGHAVRYGAMTRNGQGEVVGGLVLMLKGANSSDVIASVKDRVAQIQKTLPPGIRIVPFLDRTKLVNNAISTVTQNLLEGALIVIFVLVLLLGNFRAGLIVASVIPLSMLFAVILMDWLGVSGNLMSLGAIDFGLIVDGAVIIVEATLHHLALRKSGGKLTEAEMDHEVMESASGIRSSAAFGEIIILIVYLPLLFLVGVEGKMFRPMAQTVSFAILGAFILSTTYVPMMSALFLSRKPRSHATWSDKFMALLQRLYTPSLLLALRLRKWVVLAALAALAGAWFLFGSLGAEFIPTLEEGDFAVETRVLNGSSISQTIDATLQAQKVLLEHFPEVKQVVGKIGSSEIPTDPMPVEAADLMIILKDKDEWVSAEDREGLADTMQRVLEAHIPGVSFGFQQPIQMRFNELMTGARQDVVVKVYGENLDSLSRYAEQVGAIASGIEGAEDLYVEQVTGMDQLVVEYNREALAQYGISIAEANQALYAGFAGQAAGQVFEGEKRFDLVVRLDESSRRSLEDLRALPVQDASGNLIPLGQVAEIGFRTGPSQIQRDDAQRRIIVGFNVRGRDVEGVVEELQARVKTAVSFAPGYYARYGGTFENLQHARARLAIAVPAALLLILFLLYFTFASLRYALLIFTAIPLSAIGGVLALWLRDMPFSISAGVGFIALFGVAVLNGIVLIGEFNRRKKEGMTDITTLIVEGTRTRLRPVIMTALVASLGFLPMALSQGGGAEVQRPLATVVIGGLISSTLLTLILLPLLYAWMESRAQRRHAAAVLPLLALIACLFPAGAARAQVPVYTEAEAIQATRSQHPAVLMARLEQEQQQAGLRTSLDLPKTQFSMLAGQYNSASKQDVNLSVSQSFSLPALYLRTRAWQESRVEEAALALAVQQQEQVMSLRTAWQIWAYRLHLTQLLAQQDSVLQAAVRAAAVRHRTGEGTVLEHSLAQARWQELQQRRQIAALEARQAALDIALLTGRTDPFRPQDSLLHALSAPPSPDTSLHSPLLALTQQRILTAERSRKLAGAQALPEFTLGYFNQSLIGTQVIQGQEVNFDAGDRFQGVQAGIAVPLWWRAHAARMQQADLEATRARTELDWQQRQLNNALIQAQQTCTQRRAALAFYETQALPAADLLLSQAQKSWQAGETDLPSFLLAQEQAARTREAWLQALLAYNLSWLQVEYLRGTL